jgi:prevent-host-death family protein
MTRSVGVHEAKTHLSRLLEEVEDGSTVEITNRGRVVARLVPVGTRTRPNWGWAQGQGWIADDFDAPLPDELQALFEGDA